MSDTTPHQVPESMAAGHLEAPYVGLRAYEEWERALFFGRDRAAARLEDEVLAAPLTVLFAPSGAGKSSLLKAKLIPDIRERQAHVVYVDDWTPEPLPTIRAAVNASLPAGVAVAPEAPLRDMGRALHQATGQGLVLVLDQFEQFFIVHPERTEALGLEIGALARSSPDAHIVLALREEYLGQLDTLRSYLLTVAQTKFRLGYMTEAEAREALESPLRAFGGNIEPALVDRLLWDLRNDTKRAEPGRGGVGSEGVSLPFLQLICRELWETCPALTVAIYESLGARQGIVKRYVDNAMKGLSPVDRLAMAQILDLLAPQAGVKMAYPLDVLGKQAKLPEAQVLSLVSRLENGRILRRREEGRIVELFHDAFSEVLRDFIDGELRAAEAAKQLRARRRRQTAIAGIAALCLLAVLAGAGWRKYTELRQVEQDLDEALRNRTCSTMLAAVGQLRESAASEPSYFERLLGSSSSSTLARLRQGLSEQAEAAARCPGSRTFASETSRNAELEIRYNEAASSRISEQVVAGIWRLFARQLWDSQRRRLPEDVQVIVDKDLNPGTFALKVGGRLLVRRSIQPLEKRIAILARVQPADRKLLVREIQALSELTEHQETRLPLFGPGTPHLGFAAAWSTPLWRTVEERVAKEAGGPVELDVLSGTEAWIALETFRSVAEQPALYLTENLTKALVLKRQEAAPCLVYAALDRFNECTPEESSSDKEGNDCRRRALDSLLPVLRETLIEAARGGYRPGTLTQVLDHISDIPSNEAEPLKLAQWLREDQGRARPPSPIALSRRRQVNWGCPAAEAAPPEQYDWVFVSNLDMDEGAAIRLRFGPEIAKSIGGDHLELPVITRMEDMRRNLERRRGVVLPGARFTLEAWAGGTYRIELPGRDLGVGQANDWSPILSELDLAVTQMPMAWITLDTTVAPWEFEWRDRMYLYGWFESRFSRNDIKVLLRGVLGLGQSEAQAQPPEWTVRHRLPWLLGSVVFWDQLCDKPTDGDCLVQGLRATQKARIEATKTQQPPLAEITQGIAALEKDDPDTADRLFAKAVQRNPATAQRGFLTAYAPRAEAYSRTLAAEACKVPEPTAWLPWGGNNQTVRNLVEDVLDLERDESKQAQLRVCALMHRLPTDSAADDASTLREFLDQCSADQMHWSPQERYWLGYRLLEAVSKQDSAPGADRRRAEGLLLGALVDASKVDAKLADTALGRLRSFCSKANRASSCYWSLVSVVEGGSLRLSAATYLNLAGETQAKSPSVTPAQTTRLRGLLELGKRAIDKEPSQESRRLLSKWVEFKGLELETALFDTPNAEATKLLERVDAHLTELRRFPKDGRNDRARFEEWAISLRAALLQILGRWPELEQLDAERAGSECPECRASTEFVSALRDGGDLKTVANRVDLALAKAEWKNEDLLFLSAMAHQLLDDERYESSASRLFLYVNHRYRDYVRLMLWWRVSQREDKERARRLLDERLLEIPLPDTEASRKRRLAEGDLGPWREALVRYFLDPSAENYARVLDPLKDRAAFAKSPFSDAGQSFSSFRCEAYFYDALLQSTSGNRADRDARCKRQLQVVVDERCYRTYEHDMAKWLLRHGTCLHQAVERDSGKKAGSVAQRRDGEEP